MDTRQELRAETLRVLRLWKDELGRLLAPRQTGVAGGSEPTTIGNSSTTGRTYGRKRLYRSRSDRMIRGVCAGLADYFGMPVALVRVAFILLSLPGVIHGIILYALLAILVPEAPYEEVAR